MSAHYDWKVLSARYLAMHHRCEAAFARIDPDLSQERRAEAVAYHEKRATDEQDRAARFEADAAVERAA